MDTHSSLSQLSPKPATAAISRPAVEAKGLVKTYPGGVQALKGVNISVRQGSVFALLGPNGAGKSTIVKILTTLSRPTAGRATIMGWDVVQEPGRVRRMIGVVAQKSSVDLEATAAENLALQGQLYGLSGAGLRRRVDGLLERLGTSLDIAAVGPNWFRYRTTNPEADNPAVLARLHELGQRVISLSPVERRLEEVYLRIVEQ